MTRLARFIVPGIPHHVTQRGNGRQQKFFCDADYTAYRDLLAEHCAAQGVPVCTGATLASSMHDAA